jgi:hypothetical protein
MTEDEREMLRTIAATAPPSGWWDDRFWTEVFDGDGEVLMIDNELWVRIPAGDA